MLARSHVVAAATTAAAALTDLLDHLLEVVKVARCQHLEL